MRVIERVTVTYVEKMVSVSMYNRDASSRSVVVCGGQYQDNHLIASCEELTVDTNGLPAVNS